MKNTTTTATTTKRERDAKVLAALTAAHQAPYTAQRGYGCGRAYVEIFADRATVNSVAAACKVLGLIFQRTAYYGMKNAIYIGYDNADGNALAKSKVFAETLRAHGIGAYDSAHGD